MLNNNSSDVIVLLHDSIFKYHYLDKVVIFLLVFIIIIFYSYFPPIYGDDNTNSVISIRSDNTYYFPNYNIKIIGNVSKNYLPVNNSIIDISVFPVHNDKSTLFKDTFFQKNGHFVYDGLKINNEETIKDVFEVLQKAITGQKLNETLFSQKYNISMSTKIGNITKSTWIVIEIRNPFLTTSAIFLYTGLIDLIILFVALTIPTNKCKKLLIGKKVAVFVFISGITLSPVLSFLFLDDSVGVNSPLSVVKMLKGNNSNNSGFQWIINIGGTKDNNFNSGIQIPLYVVIFGISGGYLRYLYETALNWKQDFENIPDSIDLELFSKSLYNIAIILISPILSITVYFILYQNGVTSHYILAIISIATGIMMQEIVDTLRTMGEGIIGNIGKKQ